MAEQSLFKVFTVSWDKLEKLLTDIDNLATRAYEIVSILPKDNDVAVIVRFWITDPEFDEEEIIRKLS